ncbi:hypothetical protein ABT143_32745 [Streptomyces sp. NPDC002033]|uniref:cupin domain-containing protein n=1 Tax=unclassified Streptomyces TaxID=2593676 RepID=UPI003330B655
MTIRPDPAAGVPADLGALIAHAPDDATGALWQLTAPARGLDSALIRLPAGAVLAEHDEAAPAVLLVVVSGTGRIDTGDGPHELRPHSAVWLAGGTRRSLAAGPHGMAYLTVHARRPGPGSGGPLGAGPLPAAAMPGAMPGVIPARGFSEGGETACLLHRVCPGCGRLAGESDARYCSRCGAGLPD